MAVPMAYEGPTPPVVAGYRVDELVGVGGTGEVWRARDVLSGRLVALKRLRHDGPPVERDRLRREAAVLAGLTSPHIVGLVTVVTSAGGLVLVLDYQGGGSLASLLRARPVLAPGEVVTIAAPLAAALAEVHALGLVHGDISPANILFSTDGRPMLSDLGVARLGGAADVPTVTAAFADPAVLDGAPFTRTSDVYALAAVCFTALTGAPPAVASAGPSLSAVAPGVPPALASIVEAALSGDVAARPDAASFSARLLEAAPAQPVRLAGATVPVESPPTAAVRRLPSPPAADDPSPSRAERLGLVLGRLRVTPRRLVSLAAVPVALGGAIWGGVAWARSSSAGAPAWTATPSSPATPSAATGPLGRPGAPDPAGGRAAGAGASSALAPSGSPRSGNAAPGGGAAPAAAAHGSGAAMPTSTGLPKPSARRSPGPGTTNPMPVRDPAQTSAHHAPTAVSTPDGQPATLTDVAALTGVLRRLDASRDTAFESGSLALLDQVYVAGSAPLAEDRSLLTSLRTAGEHAVGLTLDVRRVTVVSAQADKADLTVTDTLPPYALVSAAGAAVHVAGRGEATWQMHLVKTQAGWRIATITTAAGASGSTRAAQS